MTDRNPQRGPVARAARVYRALLRFYPADIRDRYGSELVRVFTARAQAAFEGGGVRRLLGYVLGASVDVVRNGVAERIVPARGASPEGHSSRQLGAWARMAELARDIGRGLRSLLRSPGFTLAAVATIGLGIGANTAIFSVVRAVLLRPLPYAQPDQLALVWSEMTRRDVTYFPLSPPDFQDMRQMSSTFSDFAAIVTFSQPLAGDGDPVQIETAGVTTNMFSLLGVRPALGRDFVAEDGTPTDASLQPGDPGFVNNMVILSHALWRDRFGSDRDVLGRVIDVGGAPAEIVGVMAPDFRVYMPDAAALSSRVDLWQALRIDFSQGNRNNVFLRVVGRLAPGSGIAQAQQELDRISADFRAQDPVKETAGHRFNVIPMQEDLVAPVRPVILALLGAVLFVLLIACANVANLMLVRSSARERELAIRSAVGGSRWRLVRHVLIESTLLSVGGGLLGIGLAIAGIRALLVLRPDELPRADAIAMDPVVLGYTALAVIVSAALFGVVPALRASRPEIANALREGGGRSPGLVGNRLLRSGVIIAEVALSLVLLIGAGLMVRSFLALQRVDPGFQAEGVLTFTVPLPFARYPQPEQRAAFIEQLHERLAGLPGVQSVGAVNPLPLDGQLFNGRWGLEQALTEPESFRQANYFFAVPGYFETVRAELIDGRTFTWADQRDSTAVVVIDETLAQLAFPGRSAVGERLLVRVTTADPVWVDVIGVVRRQRHSSLATDDRETIFFSDGYVGGGFGQTWVVRTAGDPAAIAPAARTQVAELDPLVPIADVRPYTDYLADAMAETRFALTLIAVFAGIALALAAVGIYGVLAYSVRQRTAEIGVRMAFGAQESRILRLIVGQGLGLAGIGVAIGIVGALALTRVMRSLLVEVTPTDPITFAGITVIFAGVAAVASLVPALRAARVDPIAALRQD